MTELIRALRDFVRDLPLSVPMAGAGEAARLRLVEEADKVLTETDVA